MQREIEPVFANVVGNGVQDLTALLVPDVVFALHESEWRLVADFAGASPQILIKFVAQVAMHQITAVLVRHHLQSGVLRQAFRHHVRSFYVGTDQLMTPPLVGKLMGSHKVGKVDVGWFHDSTDETNAFRVGNRVGEGLGETAIARKLVDAVLRELVRAVDALIVVESGAGAGEHIVYVVGVRGIVVDLEGNIAARTVMGFFPYLVMSGDVGEEVEDVGRSHAVFEETAAGGLPFALQISGGDRNLIGGSAHHRVIGNPVRLPAEENVVHRVHRIAALNHFF